MNEFEKQLAEQPLKSVPTEWRTQILKEARAQATRDVPARAAQPWSWLRELFWPCPQAWAALAAVWMVMAVFQFMTPASSVSGGEVAGNSVTSVSEQRRELARLLDATAGQKEQPPADRPRGARPVDYIFV